MKKKKKNHISTIPQKYTRLMEKAFSRANAELPNENYSLALLGDTLAQSVETVLVDLNSLNQLSAKFITEQLIHKARTTDADFYMIFQFFGKEGEEQELFIAIETKEGRWAAVCSEKKFRSKNNNFKKLEFGIAQAMKPIQDFYGVLYEMPSPETDLIFGAGVLKKISESHLLKVSSLILNYELEKDINSISTNECRDLCKRIYEEIASITGISFESFEFADAVRDFKTLYSNVQMQRKDYESALGMDLSFAHTLMGMAFNDYFRVQESQLKKKLSEEQLFHSTHVSILEAFAVVAGWLEDETQILH